MRRVLRVFLLILIPTLAFAGRSRVQNAPFNAVIDNAYVKVTRFDVPPQSSAPLSAAPGDPVLLVRLRPVTPPNGSAPQPASLRFEIVSYLAGPDALANAPKSGARPAFDVAIEYKSAPPSAAFEKDAVALDPAHNSVLFENALFRVVEVHFGIGEKGPVVDKRPRVIILLTDMHAQVMKPGGAPEDRDGKSGTIQWSLGGSQATMNRNETPLDNIVVELKGK
jgi:hypothetical protein